MKKSISIALVLVLTSMIFTVPMVGAASNTDFAGYIFDSFEVSGGQGVSYGGNFIVNGEVKGLNNDIRVQDGGKLYADVENIQQYGAYKGTIDTYLASEAYQGETPNLSFVIKDFPDNLTEKPNLRVTENMTISESGWYKELEVTDWDTVDHLTINAEEGKIIELRIDKLILKNSIKIVGGGKVIFYVDNIVLSSIPRINEGGDPSKVALRLADNNRYSISGLHGSFNIYTNTSTINFSGNVQIRGNIYSNGNINTTSTFIVHGFVGGNNLNIRITSGDENRNIIGKLVAKTAYFSHGASVKYGVVGDIFSGFANVLGEPIPTTPPSDEYVNGILGEYYDACEFDNDSALRMKRIDNNIAHNYMFGSPHPVIEPEYFSIRWTGFIKPDVTGNYTFKTYSDDGVVLSVNNTKVIDNWGGLSLDYTIASQTVFLEADTYYPISLEYQQLPIFAAAFLFWQAEDVPMSLVPESVFFVPQAVYNDYSDEQFYNIISRTGAGFSNAFYTLNAEGTERVQEYHEINNVDYRWGLDAPPTITDDVFYGIMEGYLEARFTQQTTLTFQVDDGIKVWIDDNLVIDEWDKHNVDTFSHTFETEAGQKYKIRIEYVDFGLGATCVMSWEGPSQEGRVIPAKFLYTE